METPDSYLSYFTPSQMTHETLEFILVKQQGLVRRLVEAIGSSARVEAKPQTLLLGPRGIGKSHIVALVYHRLKAEENANSSLILAWLAEEEWGVASLADFFLVVLRSLEREYGGLQERIAALYRLPVPQIAEAAAALLRTFIGERTLVVLLENLEEIFRGLDDQELRSLRTYLSVRPFIIFLATTPSLFTNITRSESPFCDFFEPIYLDELSVREATELLGKVAERRNDNRLSDFLKTPLAQERVQVVHDLAGGHPRIYLLFAHLLTQETLDELVTPFRELLDELTPYYQSRMQLLSPQQRKIIEFLCDRRGAVSVKEIAAQKLITPQTASSQLDKLEEMAYVRKNTVGRESHYELREPLLRMVIEVKRGRGEPIRLIVDFLRLWYSRTERENRLAQTPEHALLTRQYLEASLKAVNALQDEAEPDSATDLKPEFHKAYQERDYAQALKLASEIIKRKGDTATADDWFSYAHCLYENKKYAAVAVSYQKGLKLDPNNAQALYSRGSALYHLERYEEAFQDYDRAVQINPRHAYSWCYRGAALYYLKRYKQASRSLEKALDLDLLCSAARTFQGLVLYQQGRYGEAIAHYDKTLQIDKPHPSLWYNRGLALYYLQRFEEALDSFEQALALDDTQADVWLWRGNAQYMLQRYLDAFVCYDKVVAMTPNHARTWNYRGGALYLLKRYDKALASFQKSLEIAPDYASAWFNQGLALYMLNRYEEALASFDRAIERDAHYIRPWNSRGVTLNKLGRYEEALINGEKLLALDPNFASAWHNQGTTLYKLKRYEEALTHLSKAIELNPQDAYVWFERAEIYLAENQWDRFFADVQQGFVISKSGNSERGNTEAYCCLLIRTEAVEWRDVVGQLAEFYAQNKALLQLGQGLTKSISVLLDPLVSLERAEQWLAVWQKAGQELSDLQVPLRLLNSAVHWKVNRDPRALLSLPQEERRILEAMLPE